MRRDTSKLHDAIGKTDYEQKVVRHYAPVSIINAAGDGTAET
jgi:hypothetical protein